MAIIYTMYIHIYPSLCNHWFIHFSIQPPQQARVDPVYQTLEETPAPTRRTTPTTPPPAHYSQVADALPSGRKIQTVCSGKLSLPYTRSGSRNSLSQVWFQKQLIPKTWFQISKQAIISVLLLLFLCYYYYFVSFFFQ